MCLPIGKTATHIRTTTFQIAVQLNVPENIFSFRLITDRHSRSQPRHSCTPCTPRPASQPGPDGRSPTAAPAKCTRDYQGTRERGKGRHRKAAKIFKFRSHNRVPRRRRFITLLVLPTTGRREGYVRQREAETQHSTTFTDSKHLSKWTLGWSL